MPLERPNGKQPGVRASFRTRVRECSVEVDSVASWVTAFGVGAGEDQATVQIEMTQVLSYTRCAMRHDYQSGRRSHTTSHRRVRHKVVESRQAGPREVNCIAKQNDRIGLGFSRDARDQFVPNSKAIDSDRALVSPSVGRGTRSPVGCIAR